jgi:hypothetical protein
MNEQRDVDTIIATWLDEGPVDLPVDTRRAISVGLRTQPRARRMAFLGGFSMLPLNRVVAATVVVLAVGAGSVLVFSNRSSGPGGVPPPSVAPSPSASASATPPTSASLLDTSTWVEYASDRYGLSISHPAEWTEHPGDHDWTFETDINAWESTAPDYFVTAVTGADLGVRTSAWSVAVAPGTTVESWIQAYCASQTAGPCTGVVAGAVPAETGDQHPGLLTYGPNTDTQAFFLDGETMYVVAIWRTETDPSVEPYGGGRALLEAFVSTLTLPAEPPQGSPGASPGA